MEKLVSETYPLLQLAAPTSSLRRPPSRTSPRLLPPGSGTRTISSRSKAVEEEDGGESGRAVGGGGAGLRSEASQK